ncbi:DNA sulfur modification protein DndD, ATPase [Halanaeroarchaeum sp. HSR-CO]|uniref:archaea-specific SMC-related protein n=1 Tax=Halanaeroarchaeum sp. HSR-CO TaxID=2866382 RepID=UPI00217D61E8|nr:archaea-specific SMC-related protein [Halanaeroarchaeum sp. HSR-CO]UWG46758.1 DNA sulfur modification protein DndD, ATPase [Halanaeroarchaeum sp. HSR-CO]
MTSEPATLEGPVRVSARNVGGIDETVVELEPGLTVLAGRNATNRTSFLRALIGALGGSAVSLKADADEGVASIIIGDEEFRRTLTRQDGRVHRGGEPFDPESDVGDLFAYLLEDNEARQAVVRGDDLREVIMRPVDDDAIRAEIASQTQRRTEIDRRLENLRNRQDRRPGLVEKREGLLERREQLDAELAEKRDELDAIDRSVAESREIEDELDRAVTERSNVRSELDDVEFRLETERDSLAALEDERAELREELDALEADDDADVESLEAEIDRLRDHKRSLDTTVNQLQRIVQFNREMVDGEHGELRDALGTTPDAVTDRLVADATVCWTCGSEVPRSRIEETVESIQDLRRETVAERQEIESTLEARVERRKTVEAERERRADLERRLENVESEIESREASIEDLADRREELDARVEHLDDRIAELEAADRSEVLTLQRAVTELEFERDQVESTIEGIDEQLGTLDEERDRIAALEAERDAIAEALTELRTRIERLEDGAVEAFNEHMATVLDVLEYENLDRIWIERTTGEGPNGEKRFDLHVVRSSDDGVSYEDTVDHLSESEREVTGLVFALAGYLVHEVYERLPFMVLDSLEAIDSDRIARLVAYFEEYPTYLVVALLPEDAEAVDVAHDCVTDI